MADGEPALSVRVDNERYKMKRPYFYCVDCKGPAPGGLPPVVLSGRTKRMTPIEGAGHAIRKELSRRLGR